MPFSVMAEIPKPVRSNALLLDAENIVLCSDFEELDAARLSLFLRELDQQTATAKVLDGPVSPRKANGLNALVVISGTETQEATQECAISTVPYCGAIIVEINTTVQGLSNGFEHPNPTINASLGDTQWASSNYYYEVENWITVVITIRNSSADQIDFKMTRLFDLPEDAFLAPTQAIAIDEDNPTQHTSVIDARLAVRFREERGKLGHLLVAQPAKVAHVTVPFSEL